MRFFAIELFLVEDPFKFHGSNKIGGIVACSCEFSFASNIKLGRNDLKKMNAILLNVEENIDELKKLMLDSKVVRLYRR